MYDYDDDLHALDSSAVACNGSNVIVGLLGPWESRRRLEAGEGGDHAGLSKAGAVRGGNGGR